VEVTSYGVDSAKLKKGAQAAVIFNAVNEMRLPPGSVLGYRLVKEGTASPPLKPLLRNVNSWVSRAGSVSTGGAPEELFAAGDWQIALTLHQLDTA
jgi:hypothetical protein